VIDNTMQSFVVAIQAVAAFFAFAALSPNGAEAMGMVRWHR